MSTPSDYFSKKARDARRQARFEKLEGKTLTADKKKKLTTQNAGLNAVKAVRDMLDSFRLPTNPRLQYSGIRALRVASNNRDVDDGIVTIHAEFRTRMGVNVGIDVPVEIHAGQLLEPSIFIHNGAPHVFAQSAFDQLVTDNTMKEAMPIRNMYAPPEDKAMDLMQRKNRTHIDRINTGMFSVRKQSRKALADAIAGRAVEAGWDKEADPADPFDTAKHKYPDMANEPTQNDWAAQRGLPPNPSLPDEMVNADPDMTNPGVTPQSLGQPTGLTPMPKLKRDDPSAWQTQVPLGGPWDPEVDMPGGNPTKARQPQMAPQAPTQIDLQRVQDQIRRNQDLARDEMQNPFSHMDSGPMPTPEQMYKGPVTTGIPQRKKPLQSPAMGMEHTMGPAGRPGDLTNLTLNQGPGEKTPSQRPPTQPDTTQPRGPDEEPTQLGMPPGMGPDETQISQPWKQTGAVEDYDAEDRWKKPDPDRNDHGDDDWLDPAETKDDNDLHVGMDAHLTEAMEVKERGGVAHDLSKGSKCEILRDHAGDNKSFVVRFDSGLEAIVERHFLKNSAKKDKPLFPKKKTPKHCQKCNKAPCICHKKKQSELEKKRGLLRQLQAQMEVKAGPELDQIKQLMTQLQQQISKLEQADKMQQQIQKAPGAPAAPEAPAAPGAPAPGVSDKPPPGDTGGPANPVKPQPPPLPQKDKPPAAPGTTTLPGDPRQRKVKKTQPAVPDMSQQQPGPAPQAPAAPGAPAAPPAEAQPPAAPPAAPEAPAQKPEFNTQPPGQGASPEAQKGHESIMQALSSHPYYEQKYGPFFKDLGNVLQKPMKEQYKYIPRMQQVLQEMQKDPNSKRLVKQVEGPIADMIEGMQPQKSRMEKFKDFFRPKEPDLWQTPQQQWTPGGIQNYTPETFKTSTIAKLAQLGHDQGFIAKVNDELNLMRDAGLDEIDLKLAVQSKYGDDVYTAIFEN